MLLFAGAWALGEPSAGGRRLLGYATVGRNVARPCVTAVATDAEPKATVMLIVTGVVGLALLLAVAAWARGRNWTTG